MTRRSGSTPCIAADVLEQPLAHRPAGGVDGAAAHPRLARRRRRAGRADRGVDRLQHDDVDAEHGAGDLLGDRDEALPDLGRGELERGDAVGEPAAGRRVVVEALGVHQVLDRHAPADAAPDVADVGGQPGAARAGASGRRRRRRRGDADRRRPASAARPSRGCSGRPGATLSTTCPVISRSPVTIALRSRISTGSSPHASASRSIWPSWAKHACTTPKPRIAPHGRWLVRTAQPVDDGVGAAVRTLGVGDGVEQHGRRRRGVGARRRARSGPRS